jgi:23S rRNA (adenine2030-N6)-methyltransferase
MLAYRHLFHAGNFADVFKHALLARLLLALGRKDKAFAYLDTHAGIGRYDLTHPWAQKNAEWKAGIGRLWGRRDLPEVLAPYLDAVRAENPGGGLRFYPGSPRVARRLLRPIDRMVLTELNKADEEALGEMFRGERRVAVHLMDGYQALKAFLPPPERRGLVLVDSSFDRAGEFQRVMEALAAAHRRWATGVLAFWYPLMEPSVLRAFQRQVADSGVRRIMRLELSIRPERWSTSLRGCGMLVVNPPFGFDAEARSILQWLHGVLAQEGQGGWRADWLVPE